MITVALDRPADPLNKDRRARLAGLAPGTGDIKYSQVFRPFASRPYLSVTPASLSLNPADNILKHFSISYQMVS